MKPVAFITCFAFIGVLLNAQVSTDSSNQIFQIPSGWARSEASGGTLLNPGSARNQVGLFLTGRPLTGAFRDAFESDIRAISAGKRTVEGGQVQNRRSSNGVELLFTTLVLKPAAGATSYNYYLAANPPGRIEIMLYAATTVDLFKQYLPDVQQFISGWTFANATDPSRSPLSPNPGGTPADVPLNPNNPAPNSAPPADTSTPPDRMDGVFLGYKFNYVTTLGVVQKRAANDYFSFFPNGTVYWGLPDHGLVGFDMARVCPSKPQSCGTYQVAGNQIAIVLNRGTYRLIGVRNAGGFNIEDRPYILQGDPAKSASHALEGVFGRADARPGEDLARKFIRFTRDGKFMDQGLVETVAGTEIINGNPRFERPAGVGTYRLLQNTLILRYSDGYQRGLPIILPPAEMDKPVPSQLLINTYTLNLRR